MSRAASAQRPPLRRWRWVVVGLILLAVLGVLALWLVIRARQAQTALTSAREGMTQVRAALEAGDVSQATSLLPVVQADTARAVSVTGDPVFSLASALPVVGNTPAAVRSVSAAADDVATQVLPSLLAAGNALDPETLRSSGNQINVSAFSKASPLLNQAADDLSNISDDIAGIDTGFTPSQVGNAVTSLQTQVDSVLSTTQSAARGAELLPPMLGADGPRRYLMAFQSNSEVRGTGGLIGSYGIVSANDGRVQINQLAPRSRLDAQTYNTMPLNFGPDYAALYGDDPASWANADMSPHYPYAAQLWLKMWQDRTGDRLDGVMTADPVTLSYLLKATGPVTLDDGRVITADNVVDFTENGIYLLYPHNDDRRDNYLQQISSGAMDAVLSGRADAQALVDALGRAAGERRLLVYSDHPAEEQELTDTAVSGVVPTNPAPMAGLALINGGGNKLDYYLRAKLDYQVLGCEADGTRLTRTTVTLANTAPDHGLPIYVDGRHDLPPGPNGLVRDANGDQFLYAQVYTTEGATLVSAQRDGKPFKVDQGRERGHPVYRAAVVVGAGKQTTLTFDLKEPPTSGAVQTFTTPLVKPTPVSADDTSCGSG